MRINRISKFNAFALLCVAQFFFLINILIQYCAGSHTAVLWISFVKKTVRPDKNLNEHESLGLLNVKATLFLSGPEAKS